MDGSTRKLAPEQAKNTEPTHRPFGFPASICAHRFAGTVCIRELDHDGRHSDTLTAVNTDEQDVDRARDALRTYHRA